MNEGDRLWLLMFTPDVRVKSATIPLITGMQQRNEKISRTAGLLQALRFFPHR
jgi:hypothetical protein